ncbi:hypothetical protein LVJ94_27520 [Pendulispora rubella]|uniref:Uncharacterized protein n=1 Tax=Pendulispora rubella TaxID=2741070 RepID=A0ABZ2KSW1_9BACT
MRRRAWPVGDAIHQIVQHWICKHIDELLESILRSKQVNDVGLLGRPKVFPSTAVSVHHFGSHFVKVGKELRQIRSIVGCNQMLVVAHRRPAMNGDAKAFGRFAQTVLVHLLDGPIGTQQILPLRTAASEQKGPPSYYLSRKCHERLLEHVRYQSAIASFTGISSPRHLSRTVG